PKSSVTWRYGWSSSDRWASKQTYARPSTNRDASIVATHRGPGRPTFSVTLVQSLPPLRVTHRKPSSVPAQSTSALRGDSERAVALPRFVRVISGEIGCRLSPLYSER